MDRDRPSSPKRRRTSSTSFDDLTSNSGLVRRRSSGTGGDVKGKEVVRHPLDGFDDEEEVDQGVESRHSSPREVRSGREGDQDDDDEGVDSCAICLAPIVNKAVITPCHHALFCLGCIRPWCDQSRKCPLCLGKITNLLYNIRSDKDYQTLHLLPLHISSSSLTMPVASDSYRSSSSSRNPPLPRHALYGRTAIDESTWREKQEERAIERRRYVYREGLYAKHVASNRYTGFKPVSPALFVSNPALKARTLKFIRRELQIFDNIDISFLTTYILSIASQLDLRSASAVRLISDFLTEDQAAHLVHEIDTFARSPFTTLEGYDRCIQYGRPERPDLAVEKAVSTGRLAPIIPSHQSALPPRPKSFPPLKRNDSPPPPPPLRRAHESGRRFSNGYQDSRRENRRHSDSQRRPYDDIHRKYRSPSPPRRRYRSPSPRSRQRSPSPIRSSPPRQRSPSPHRRQRSPSRSPAPALSPSPQYAYRRESTDQGRSEQEVASNGVRPPSPAIDDEDAESDAFSIGPGPSLHIALKTTPVSLSPYVNSPVLSEFPSVDFSTAAAPGLSIFGAARRRVTPSTASLTSESYFEALPAAEQDLSPPSIVAPPSPAIVNGTPTDLRSILQARLTAEYRTALTSKLAQKSGVNLKNLLHARLRAEKSEAALRISMANGVGDHQGGSYDDDEDDYEVEEEDLDWQPSSTTFSAETRALLLARLEEEKRAMEVAPPSPSLGVGTEARESKEEALRKALASRKSGQRVVMPSLPVVASVTPSVAQMTMEEKAEELRQKLKARSLAARAVPQRVTVK